MKSSLFSGIMAAMLASATPMLHADDKTGLQHEAAVINSMAATAEGQNRVLQAISAQTGVPVATLIQQRKATGFGFGELTIANSLAQATGKTFDALAAEFKSGKGWGEIAKENNVKLGDVVSKVHESGKAAENAKGGPGTGASDGPGKSGSAGKGAGKGNGGGPSKGGGGKGKK